MEVPHRSINESTARTARSIFAKNQSRITGQKTNTRAEDITP
jgi:hypothetical protein